LLDVIAMMVGLMNLLSTWRAVLPLTISGSLALLLLSRLGDRFDALLGSVVVIIVGLVIGLGWQIRFERSRRR
jgi:hypothetical protein